MTGALSCRSPCSSTAANLLSVFHHTHYSVLILKDELRIQVGLALVPCKADPDLGVRISPLLSMSVLSLSDTSTELLYLSHCILCLPPLSVYLSVRLTSLPMPVMFALVHLPGCISALRLLTQHPVPGPALSEQYLSRSHLSLCLSHLHC